ncbi:MAG: SGNH/GDSL hydrolase family protein [Gemmataceae bacterium]
MSHATRFMFACLGVTLAIAPASAQDFFFKKGDVIVVMGDSITEQRLYSNYLETWSQTRFPNYNLVFRNVGIGGDRSTGGNSRFKRDVLSHKPTVLTVDFGMNDGSYRAFDEKIFDTYVKGLQGIADQAKAAKIRVAWITPQPTERREPGNQLAGYNETLKRFGLEGVGGIAKKNDGLFVDQFTPYLNVMNKARETNDKIIVTEGDAVHPGPAGQSLMAASILKGLSFPREVSSVIIDASGKAEGTRCKVSDVVAKDNGIRFRRHDEAIPYFPEAAKKILKWSPILEDMNHYGLKVTGLKAGKYEVKLGSAKVAEYSADELAKGVNLAEAALTKGPVADQAKAVEKAVNAKTTQYHDQIFRGLILNGGVAKLPEFKDLGKADIEKRRQALIEERLVKTQELDEAIRKSLEITPHVVEIVPAQ